MPTARVLALAGCALFAVACAQDRTTAPPVATETDATAALVPATFGSESGTITLTKDRSQSGFCLVKISLKGLYDATGGDSYWLYLAEPGGTIQWSLEIPDDSISARGTYATQVSIHSEKLGLYPMSLRYLDQVPGTGWYKIADFGWSPPESDADFKATNRCF